MERETSPFLLKLLIFTTNMSDSNICINILNIYCLLKIE